MVTRARRCQVKRTRRPRADLLRISARSLKLGKNGREDRRLPVCNRDDDLGDDLRRRLAGEAGRIKRGVNLVKKFGFHFDGEFRRCPANHAEASDAIREAHGNVKRNVNKSIASDVSSAAIVGLVSALRALQTIQLFYFCHCVSYFLFESRRSASTWLAISFNSTPRAIGVTPLATARNSFDTSANAFNAARPGRVIRSTRRASAPVSLAVMRTIWIPG